MLVTTRYQLVRITSKPLINLLTEKTLDHYLLLASIVNLTNMHCLLAIFKLFTSAAVHDIFLVIYLFLSMSP